jgi:lipopolysaccharide export system protein LptA
MPAHPLPLKQHFRSLLYHTQKTHKTVWSIATLLISLLSQNSLYAMPSEAHAVNMNADQQTYNVATKRYDLTGRVHVTFQDLDITAKSAQIQMDSAGKPSVANFFNRPVFKRTIPNKGQDQVVGDIIRIYLNEERYGAIGHVESRVVTVASDPFLIRSDAQEFDTRNKVVSASGNVQVDYSGSKAYSRVANLRMKPTGEAERVIFSGNASIKKESSEIHGEQITVMVGSGNLIAENNVKTRVTLKPKAQPAVAQPSNVFISSDYQQYDKHSDVMIASGHVKIIYGDYVATGPKATFQLNNNDLDKIVLTGRSTIVEQGRTITADKIIITTQPKNFDAVGNVKVKFQTKSASSTTPAASKKGAPSTPSAGGAGKPAKVLPVDHDYEY